MKNTDTAVSAILIITLLPESVQMRAQQFIEGGNLMPLAVGVLLFFLVLDTALLGLANYRFQRSRLILD